MSKIELGIIYPAPHFLLQETCISRRSQFTQARRLEVILQFVTSCIPRITKLLLSISFVLPFLPLHGPTEV